MELRRECARSRDGNDDWMTLLTSYYAIILSPGLILLSKKWTKIPEKATQTSTNYRLSSKKTFRTSRWALDYLEKAGKREGVWAAVTIPVDRILFFFPSVQMCFQLSAVSWVPLCPFSIVLLSFFTHQLKPLLFWARYCPLASSWVITQWACN